MRIHIYNAGRLFIIPNTDETIKSLVYLTIDNKKKVIRKFGMGTYVDIFLNQSYESKTLLKDLKRRIKINDFLTMYGFSGYIKDLYGDDDIILFYRALVMNLNFLSPADKFLFDKLATMAALKWCQLIDFTDNYDLSFLTNNPSLTTLNDPYTNINNNISIEEAKAYFKMCLISYIKMLLYALGNNYEHLEETAHDPIILKIVAEKANIKGYIDKNTSMSFRNGQVFVESFPSNVIRMADYKRK